MSSEVSTQPNWPDVSTGLTPASQPMAPATWGWLVAIVLLTIAMSFYDLGGGADFEPTDAWVAQTAREMLDRGNWIVPYFADELRAQKSPGPYWAVMVTSLALGREIDEVTTRIPNGFAALAIVLTIFCVTRRIAGDRAAIFASAAAAGSTFILYWSHRGASDMGLAACCTVSLAAFWVALGDMQPGGRRRWVILLGYFAAGLGMLYKLPMPIACVGVPMFLYVLLRNRWKGLFDWAHLVGIGVFLLPWLPWAIVFVQVEPTVLDKWRVEFLDRFTGELPNVADQQADWKQYLTYLYVPLIYCLPFSLSLPAALLRGFRKTEGVSRDGAIFMLIWFFGLLAFFTAAAGKEMRYFLPALPPLFVLLGVELALLFDPRAVINRTLVKVSAYLTALLVPGGFAAAIYVLHQKWYPLIGAANRLEWSDLWPPLVISGVITSAFAIACAMFYTRQRRNLAYGVLVAMLPAMWFWTWPRVMPFMVSAEPYIHLGHQLQSRLSDEQRSVLRYVGTQDSRLLWYGDNRLPRLIDQLDLLAEQDGKRDLTWERQRYAQEVIDRLSDDEFILLAITVDDYVLLQGYGPVVLPEQGRRMPHNYRWMMPEFGNLRRYVMIIGNQQPDWDEPPLPDLINNAIAKTRARAQGELDAGSLVFMGMKIEKQAGDDLEAPTPPSQQDHDE
jgi:4-amino-4-deoxy-L-arabinose transferase